MEQQKLRSRQHFHRLAAVVAGGLGQGALADAAVARDEHALAPRDDHLHRCERLG